MCGKYTLFVNPLKTGDITHMRRQCVPAFPLGGGGRGLGTRLTSNLKWHDFIPLDTYSSDLQAGFKIELLPQVKTGGCLLMFK